MRIKYGLLLLILVMAALFAACEQAPGEITGQVTKSDGSQVSAIIKVYNSAGNVVERTSSNTRGVYYTGRTLPPGKYTVRAFKRGEQVGEDYEVTVTPDGSIVCNIVI
jgi:hypothetical protein